MGTYMADKYPDMKVTVFSFAGPRVGNQAFKDWSEAKPNLASWRYVYRKDLVPRQGPRALGFVDTGHTVQIYYTWSLWGGEKGHTSIYYRHIGNGGSYVGVPDDWYDPRKYKSLVCSTLLQFFRL